MTWNSTVCLGACLNHVSSLISFFIRTIKVNQRNVLLTRSVWMPFLSDLAFILMPKALLSSTIKIPSFKKLSVTFCSRVKNRIHDESKVRQRLNVERREGRGGERKKSKEKGKEAGKGRKRETILSLGLRLER